MLKRAIRCCTAAAVLFAPQVLFTDYAAGQDKVGPAPRFAAVADCLHAAIAYEMADKKLPAVAIALVEDQEPVWARGFGFADPVAKIPATAGTVYRVGSVSKLFTDLAVMQLVERGELDLDAPITRYLPEFRPENPFDKPITLRQLMAHRAGLVREPPLGHYFDPTEPTLEATVRSLNRTRLVYAPGTRIKYSNAAIATVGYVLERLKNMPFAEYVRRAVLQPLGLHHSAFRPAPALRQRLAKARMWSYEGRDFPAPEFELGMSPAGCMYATVLDLARFLEFLFAPEKTNVLEPETLQKMWQPQFTARENASGYGLGFRLSQFQGHKLVGHGGAIYGFATQLYALPDDKLGVVAITSMDVANAVMRRIADYALALMITRRQGKTLPAFQRTTRLRGDLARRMDGVYTNGERFLTFEERNGELFAWYGSVRSRVKKLGKNLILDDRHIFGPEIALDGPDAIKIRGNIYRRLPAELPAEIPGEWAGLIGEYGWEHNKLFILERYGRLHALIEWVFLYPLEQVSRDVFAFPDYGLYHGEHLIFSRDEHGRATQVLAAGILFKRRTVWPEAGETFRIVPLSLESELRKRALAAQPPVQEGDYYRPDLVDLAQLEPSLEFDIRYATTNNFMGMTFYSQARAFLQRPAAEALVRVHHKLMKKGYGLLIHDAYRPWYVTKMFWDATPDSLKHFVADPARGSIHNRGAAVDLTLYDLKTGQPVDMVSGYDEFSARAYPDYPGGTSRQRWLRELLRDAMEAEGFTVYKWEWWHFNYREAGKYPVLNIRFEEIQH